MDEKDLIILTETAARSKSNSKQIEEIKDEVKEIRNEQKAIYEIASSVKLIAQDMGFMKESLNEVKRGQKALTEKVDEQITEVKDKIEKVDSKSKIDIIEAKRDSLKQKLIPFICGGGAVSAVVYIVSEIIKSLAK